MKLKQSKMFLFNLVAMANSVLPYNIVTRNLIQLFVDLAGFLKSSFVNKLRQEMTTIWSI